MLRVNRRGVRAATLRVLGGLLVVLLVGTAVAPASMAAVIMRNFIQNDLQVADNAPLYSYSSGTSQQWITNAAFGAGTLAGVQTSKAQNYAAAQVTGGQISVRTAGTGASASAPEWGPAINLPANSTGASKVSVAARADGLLAVTRISGTTLEVARQVAPGVWPSTLTWVNVSTQAVDAEIQFGPTGLLSASYQQAVTGSSLVRSETSVGAWGSVTDLGGVVLDISLAVYPNGDLLVAGVGSNGYTLWTRTYSGGVWSAWVTRCNLGILNPISDLSVAMSASRAGIYATVGTSIVSCTEPATGTTWKATTVYTGITVSSTIGAVGRFDGQILVLASVGGVQQSAVQSGLDQSIGSFAAIDGSFSDQQVTGFYPDNALELAQSGTTYATSGTWTSAILDTGTSGSGVYGLLRTSATVPGGTDVRFQVAASASGVPSSFVGPDGTAATTYPSSGGPMPYAVDGMRYLRVRAILTGSASLTPRVNGLSVTYNLTRLSRSTNGTFAVTAPADYTSWIARMSTPATSLSSGTTRLADLGSTWGASNSFTASLDNTSGQCCAATQFTVTSGTSTPSGAGGTAVLSSGGRLGQSYVLQRSKLYSGTGAITATASLSSSLQVQWPMAVTLNPDIAIGMTASQKSNYAPTFALASAGVDGNIDGSYSSGSILHTADPGVDPPGAVQAWWKVDLGSAKPVEEIRIWNRTDCCSARMRDFTVLAALTPIDTTTVQTAMQSVYAANGYVRTFSGVAGPRTDVSLLPTGSSARYVAVILTSKAGMLNLAEIEVRS